MPWASPEIEARYMRFLGQITGRAKAETFVAYLLTKGVSTHIDGVQHDPDQWEVWVRDEDCLDEARRELVEFQQHPDEGKYKASIAEAAKILKDKQAAALRAQKNIQRMGNSPGRLIRGGIPPLTTTLLVICIAASLAANFMEPSPSNKLGIAVAGQLSFVSAREFVSSNDAGASLKRGEFWRAITPIFLHGSPIHLALNMMFLVSIGRIVERLEGPLRFALIVLLSAVIPNLWQGLSPPELYGGPAFVGISGVLYGLFGFLWIKSTLRPELGFRVPGTLIIMLLAILFLGFSGVFKGVANLCHLGGLLVGSSLGWLDANGSRFGKDKLSKS